jgi:hypothetical protein
MNGKVNICCLLLLLGTWAHAAPEQFGLFGEVLQPDIPTLPFQFPPTGVVDATTFPSFPVVSFQPDTTTKQFQFGSPNLDDVTTTFPSILVGPLPLDTTNQFQFGSPDLDFDSINYGDLLAGLGFGGPGVGGGSCPQVPDGTPCTLNYLPMSCGDGGCVYDNSCLAEAAGFTEGQCELVMP